MAKLWSSECRLYFGAYDVGTATTRVNLALVQDALEKTAIGDAAESFIAGIRRDTMEWAGLFDGSLSMDAAMAALIGSGTNNTVSLLLGTATGNRAYSGTVLGMSAAPAVSIGALVTQEASIQPDGSWRPAVHYGPKRTISAYDLTGTHDHGTETTAGGQVYVHVFDWTASGGNARWQGTFIHSVTGGLWTVVQAFNIVGTGAPTPTAISVTIQRRTGFEFTLDAVSGTLAFFVAFARS